MFITFSIKNLSQRLTKCSSDINILVISGPLDDHGSISFKNTSQPKLIGPLCLNTCTFLNASETADLNSYVTNGASITDELKMSQNTQNLEISPRINNLPDLTTNPPAPTFKFNYSRLIGRTPILTRILTAIKSLNTDPKAQSVELKVAASALRSDTILNVSQSSPTSNNSLASSSTNLPSTKLVSPTILNLSTTSISSTKTSASSTIQKQNVSLYNSSMFPLFYDQSTTSASFFISNYSSKSSTLATNVIPTNLTSKESTSTTTTTTTTSTSSTTTTSITTTTSTTTTKTSTLSKKL